MSENDNKNNEEENSKKKLNNSDNDDFINDFNNQLFELFKEHSEVPNFIKNFVDDFQKKVGVEFQTVNVRVVSEDDLDTLPTEVLTQILDRAVEQEHYELASKVRDVINSKN
jgi:hypothetical protein